MDICTLLTLIAFFSGVCVLPALLLIILNYSSIWFAKTFLGATDDEIRLTNNFIDQAYRERKECKGMTPSERDAYWRKKFTR